MPPLWTNDEARCSRLAVSLLRISGGWERQVGVWP